MSNRPRRDYIYSIHGQPWYWYATARRANGQPARPDKRPIRFQSATDINFEKIIKPDNLLTAFGMLEAKGGPAPGPDGFSFRDLGRQERPAAMRELHQTIHSGSFQPGPARRVNAPKPTGGTRPLKMRNVLDRTVSKALTEAISPALDGVMLPCSMGFRPGRGHLHMLAEVAAVVELKGRCVFAEDDINKAFDNVPVAPTVELFREHIPDPRTVDLIETILRGHERAHRQIGLHQGDPLSPLAMNLLLTYVLDGPITSACPGTPFLRYADNLVWLCRNVSEGRHALTEATHLLRQTGMGLKGHEPVDLSRHGSRVQILGFHVSRQENQVMFSIADTGWDCLGHNLAMAHDTPHPTEAAVSICEGWIAACGPAFENAAEICTILDMVRRKASRYGYREISSADRLIWLAWEAQTCWRRLLGKARERLISGQQQCGPCVEEVAAHPRARNDRPSDGGTVAGRGGASPAASGHTPIVAGEGSPTA